MPAVLIVRQLITGVQIEVGDRETDDINTEAGAHNAELVVNLLERGIHCGIERADLIPNNTRDQSIGGVGNGRKAAAGLVKIILPLIAINSIR